MATAKKTAPKKATAPKPKKKASEGLTEEQAFKVFQDQIEESKQEIFNYYSKKLKLPEALKEPCKNFFNWGFEYGGFFILKLEKKNLEREEKTRKGKLLKKAVEKAQRNPKK